jgi:two-component system chemotaxis response regulator CheY
MRVLIVDDSSTMRRIIANTLKKLGYEDIVEAGDGAEGLQVLASEGADLVLTDWNMPKMDGREFVRNLRTMPDMERVPVLMVTTHAERNDVVLALQAGVNDYVVKPFTPELLQEKITSLAVKVRA